MIILGIIPARYASQRFPGKPLAIINGKPMIQRVWEQCRKTTKLTHVVVATDDDRIKTCVESFGGQAVMTSSEHKSGTDRCAEAMEILEMSMGEINAVINIQGDEPYIHPHNIDLLCSHFINSHDTEIASLAVSMNDMAKKISTDIVKVVCDKYGKALYFSRLPIPFFRNGDEQNEGSFLKHLGIYGYRADVLRELTQTHQGFLENAEQLEQLRWLEHGKSIHIIQTKLESQSVDTPDDLRRLSENKQ